jgi:hypothetical protein
MKTSLGQQQLQTNSAARCHRRRSKRGRRAGVIVFGESIDHRFAQAF